MKRLDIIVEGPSEREFISQSLAPYLEREGVILSYDVSPIVIHTKAEFSWRYDKVQSAES